MKHGEQKSEEHERQCPAVQGVIGRSVEGAFALEAVSAALTAIDRLFPIRGFFLF